MLSDNSSKIINLLSEPFSRVESTCGIMPYHTNNIKLRITIRHIVCLINIRILYQKLSNILIIKHRSFDQSENEIMIIEHILFIGLEITSSTNQIQIHFNFQSSNRLLTGNVSSRITLRQLTIIQVSMGF